MLEFAPIRETTVLPKWLYVDDIRNPARSTFGLVTWVVVRTFEDALGELSVHRYDGVSLDYDLGSSHTGMDILMFLLDRKRQGKHIPKCIDVHSSHEHGKHDMINFISVLKDS